MESLYQYVVSNKKIVFVAGLGTVAFLFLVVSNNNNQLDQIVIDAPAQVVTFPNNDIAINLIELVASSALPNKCINKGGTWDGLKCHFSSTQFQAIRGNEGSQCRKIQGAYGSSVVIQGSVCVLKKPVSVVSVRGYAINVKRTNCNNKNGFFSSNNTCYKGAL